MTGNIYSWIFPAAVFTAAALSSLTPSPGRKKRNYKKRSHRLVWFSLHLSAAVALTAVSVFFVQWADVEWSRMHLLFFLSSLAVFYLCFVLKFFIGLPVFILLLLFAGILNIYLGSWVEVSDNIPFGKVRILSDDRQGLVAELSLGDKRLKTVYMPSSNPFLELELLDVSRTVFTATGQLFCRYPQDSTGDNSFTGEKLIAWILDNTTLMNKSRTVLDLSGMNILYSYDIILNEDRKIILSKN